MVDTQIGHSITLAKAKNGKKKEQTPQNKTNGVQFSRLQHCLDSNLKQN